jgi:hypothetical protein
LLQFVVAELVQRQMSLEFHPFYNIENLPVINVISFDSKGWKAVAEMEDP